MVTIDYNCDVTGQKMRITITDAGDYYNVKAEMNFDPPVSQETKDEFGVIRRMLDAFND